jgi:hypothetical protein
MQCQRHIGFVLFWLIAWLSGSALLAQSRTSAGGSLPVYTGSDRGIFKVYSSGQLVGEESFQIVPEGANFKASGETRLTVERINTKVSFNIKVLLQFTKNFEPINYQISQEASGNTARARVKFKSGSSEVVYETGKENDVRAIELNKDVVVLDNNVYHHYILLARRYDFLKGGQQEFSAFVPQGFLSGAVTVSDKGMEYTLVGSATVQLQHLVVDTGELQIHLWLDADHVVRKMSVPQSQVDVVRE